MKFIIGLLIGAGLAYGWFSTYGRLQQTDVVIETRTNTVTRVQYETVIATQDVYRSVWQTNVITVTNFVKNTTSAPKDVINTMYIPAVPKTITAQQRQNQPKPTIKTEKQPTKKSSFDGPHNLPGRDRKGRKLPGVGHVHIGMDGKIIKK